MLLSIYLIPLLAWYAFIYHMHQTGGRPTTNLWWAFMTGLGTFELGKGLFTEMKSTPPIGAAFVAAVLAAGLVLELHARRAAKAKPAMETGTASPAVGR